MSGRYCNGPCFFFFAKFSCASLGCPYFATNSAGLTSHGFPIEVEDLIIRSQIVFGVAMAIQAPRHAVWLGDLNDRHVIDRPVAAETTDAPVHVRRVIIVNVINRAIEPHPFDWFTAFPTLLHRLQLGIVLCNLRVAIHARRSVRHVRLCGHFHKAVTISTIHPQLGDVNIMRKRRIGCTGWYPILVYFGVA